jgi:hypothetical protein
MVSAVVMLNLMIVVSVTVEMLIWIVKVFVVVLQLKIARVIAMVLQKRTYVASVMAQKLMWMHVLRKDTALALVRSRIQH